MCLVDIHLYMKALQISRHVIQKDTFVQVKGLLLISAVFVHSIRSGKIPAADLVGRSPSTRVQSNFVLRAQTDFGPT
jgi:hypothetical protein